MDCGYIKKLICYLLVVQVVLCCGCQRTEKNADISQECLISEIAEKYLRNKGISKCTITFCGDYKTVPYEFSEENGDKSYWDKLIANSEFVIDQNEVADYSIAIVENYDYIANLYGLELREYQNHILKKDEDTFYQNCFSEGCYDVQKMLLIGYIAEKENVTISTEEKEEFCKENGYVYEKMETNAELFDFIEYTILEQKVVKVIQEYTEDI